MWPSSNINLLVSAAGAAAAAAAATYLLWRRIVRQARGNGCEQTQSSALDVVVIEPPRERHTATVILLAGFGEDAASHAKEFSWFAHLLDMPYARFISPVVPSAYFPPLGATCHAQIYMSVEEFAAFRKKRPDFVMPGTPKPWPEPVQTPPHDYTSETDGGERLLHNARLLDQLIGAEIRDFGISPRRIVIVGSSCGGALALTAGLRSKHGVGCIVAQEAWLPRRDEYPSALGPYATGTRVLWCQGENDVTHTVKDGEVGSALLRSAGVPSELRTFDFQHTSFTRASIDGGTFNDVRAFVRSVLE
jgi:predicted esterase